MWLFDSRDEIDRFLRSVDEKDVIEEEVSSLCLLSECDFLK